MALAVNSVTRLSGGNCDHFSLDYTVDGTNRVIRIEKSALANLFSSLNETLGLPGNAKDILMLGILQYYVSKNTYTLAQLPAKCVLAD